MNVYFDCRTLQAAGKKRTTYSALVLNVYEDAVFISTTSCLCEGY